MKLTVEQHEELYAQASNDFDEARRTYWALHKHLSRNAYSDSGEQHRDIMALSGLAIEIDDALTIRQGASLSWNKARKAAKTA